MTPNNPRIAKGERKEKGFMIDKNVVELIEGAKLMRKVLEQLISQKNIGKMAFDIGDLNDGFLKTDRAIKILEAR